MEFENYVPADVVNGSYYLHSSGGIPSIDFPFSHKDILVERRKFGDQLDHLYQP